MPKPSGLNFKYLVKWCANGEQDHVIRQLLNQKEETMIIDKSFRGDNVKKLEGDLYVHCDFSNSKITADMTDKKFKNCIFFNVDMTEAIMDKSSKFDFSGQKNPFKDRMKNGEPKVKLTNAQRVLLCGKSVTFADQEISI